jgi:MOSC domain-containing protein YiiM
MMQHPTMDELEAGLPVIAASPRDEGALELIVRRPVAGAREVVAEGELDVLEGLVGDSWRSRAGSMTAHRSPDPDTQLTVMSARVAALVAQDKARWALAGDQLFVDLDLSTSNLPSGTVLAIGSALIEVSHQPHTGCGNFVKRFGVDAMKFVNSPLGQRLNLRGINARVVRGGAIRVGDAVRKVPAVSRTSAER